MLLLQAFSQTLSEKCVEAHNVWFNMCFWNSSLKNFLPTKYVANQKLTTKTLTVKQEITTEGKRKKECFNME